MLNIDNFNPNDFFIYDNNNTCQIHLIDNNNYDSFHQSLSIKQQNYLKELSFSLEDTHPFILPDYESVDNHFSVLIPFDSNDYLSILTKIDSLPKAIKSIAFTTKPDNFDYQTMAYYWGAHFYNFDYYKKNDHKSVKLYIPELSPRTNGQLRALFLGRNAINLPAEDLTPQILQNTLESFALEFGATIKAFVGSELLDNNFNLIHAVGRGIIDDNRQPRLIDFYYKTPISQNAKTITLVGKGVCFDNGGLNIKTGGSMGLMKKDMGGAATVLAVGLNLLLQKPDFNLRILIPAVENNIHANSFRPGDIYTAYNGKTVEITNTDAEGRLILGDAIAYAAQDNPDLLIDVATLTGAARVALGADLPVLYTNNPDLVPLFMKSDHYHEDPVWELPLWKPYDKAMKGTISDLINSEAGGMAGSIKAALFIQHFIGTMPNWVHFDSYCYVQESKPARPKGGDVMPYLTLSDAIQKFVLQ